MQPLNLIDVSESASAKLHASGATLAVAVSGESFFTGSEAFKKADEVVSLVAALVECGLDADDVNLLDVSIRVESGFLSRSSQASYHLLVECPSTELLGPVLAAIASRKNCETMFVDWRYEQRKATKVELQRKAVRAAHATARTAADALGVRLLGVHELSVEVDDGERRTAGLGAVSEFDRNSRRRKGASLESLRLEHTMTMFANAKGRFIVDLFDTTPVEPA